MNADHSQSAINAAGFYTWKPRSDMPTSANTDALITVLLSILTGRVKDRDNFIVPILRTLETEIMKSHE